MANDPKDPDALWVTEVWDSEAAWAALIEWPAVKASIDKALPLIPAFGGPVVTEPVGLLP